MTAGYEPVDAISTGAGESSPDDSDLPGLTLRITRAGAFKNALRPASSTS